MIIIKGDLLEVAVIDFSKKYGEPGQYIKHSGQDKGIDLIKVISVARLAGKEIRYYYQDLTTSNGEKIPAKVIITETPPGFVQPFHVHDKIHEITRIDQGELFVIESEILKESDLEEIKKQGQTLEVGDMVIEDPGVRHTHLNISDKWTVTTTVQTAKKEFEDFAGDWKR